MPVEPIQVQLSPYEKVQILRDQLEERQKELSDTEIKIRDLQREIASQRFLETLSPYYSMQSRDGMPSPDQVSSLEQHRNLLMELIATIERELPATLESAQKGGPAPAAEAQPQLSTTPGAPVRKAKFDF